MAKVRKDNKGRNLRPGETQRADGSYMYVYKLDLGSHSAKERIEWPLHVVLYSEHYIGSCSGHWCALSAAGCGYSADRSPLL